MALLCAVCGTRQSQAAKVGFTWNGSL
jgi:hypothetical protein